MNSNQINMISNNVNGIQSTKKRIKNDTVLQK